MSSWRGFGGRTSINGGLGPDGTVYEAMAVNHDLRAGSAVDKLAPAFPLAAAIAYSVTGNVVLSFLLVNVIAFAVLVWATCWILDLHAAPCQRQGGHCHHARAAWHSHQEPPRSLQGSRICSASRLFRWRSRRHMEQWSRHVDSASRARSWHHQSASRRRCTAFGATGVVDLSRSFAAAFAPALVVWLLFNTGLAAARAARRSDAVLARSSGRRILERVAVRSLRRCTFW
jgi:hypothetical protein